AREGRCFDWSGEGVARRANKFATELARASTQNQRPTRQGRPFDLSRAAQNAVLEKPQRPSPNTPSGLSGNSVNDAARTPSASQTALAMAPPSPGLPHSPSPRRPSGLVVARTSW